MEAVDEYFDMLIKSRFIEMFASYEKTYTFAEVITDNTRKGCKFDSCFYQKEGEIAIVDQGREPFCGRINEQESCKPWTDPAIIFGDHTELFKCVEVPFYLGADGTKLLSVHEGWNIKFVYYFLKYNYHPTGGYRRHFVFVKEQLFSKPPIFLQIEFANFVIHVDKTKAICKKIIQSLNNMVKSRFIEMFGTIENPKYRTVQISELVSKTIEKVAKTYDSEDFIQYIDISSIIKDSKSVGNMTEYVVKEAPSRAQQCVKKGDILLSNVRPNLKTIAIVDSNENNLVCSSGFSVLRCEKCEPEYLITAITDDMFTDLLMKKATGSSYPAVATKDVLGQEIPYGPEDVQKNFATLVKQVDKSKFEVVQSLLRLKSKYIRTETPSKRTD